VVVVIFIEKESLVRKVKDIDINKTIIGMVTCGPKWSI
jgi:hypothetical protein